MVVRILKSAEENNAEREYLINRGLSFLDISGDYLKSWDVARAIRFIERNVDKNENVLDLGTLDSEIVHVLIKLEYKSIFGIDLNEDILNIRNGANYIVGDYMKTPFPDENFSAVTAISTIEHGFQKEKLLQEMSRIIRPGGWFLATFDYWPEKIDTSHHKIFGMDWKIFAQYEVEDLLISGRQYGFVPQGKLNYKANKKSINFDGFEYTAGQIIMRKQ